MARVSGHIKGSSFVMKKIFSGKRARGLDERSGVGPTIERGT